MNYRIFSERELAALEAGGAPTRTELLELIRGYRKAKHDGEMYVSSEPRRQTHIGKMAAPVTGGLDEWRHKKSAQ